MSHLNISKIYSRASVSNVVWLARFSGGILYSTGSDVSTSCRLQRPRSITKAGPFLETNRGEVGPAEWWIPPENLVNHNTLLALTTNNAEVSWREVESLFKSSSIWIISYSVFRFGHHYFSCLFTVFSEFTVMRSLVIYITMQVWNFIVNANFNRWFYKILKE